MDLDNPPRATPSRICLLLKKDSYYPVFLNVCERLDIASIIALSRTCKALSTIYRDLLPILWNVNRSLKRYVKNPKGLRSQLAANNALISGSFLLQFLDRVHYPDADLDIFESLLAWGENEQSKTADYLIEEEGYNILWSDEGRLGYRNRSLASVEMLTRARPNGNDGEVDKVQVITFEDETVLGILTTFWCTTVTNLMSWNKIYAIYPQQTFIERSLRLTNPTSSLNKTRANVQPIDEQNGPGYMELRDKYENRGWSFALVSKPEQIAYLKSPFSSTRMLADTKTWQLKLDTADVEASPTPDCVLEASSWSFVHSHDSYLSQWERVGDIQHGFPTVEVKAFSYKHPCLQYPYIFAGSIRDKESWTERCTQVLDSKMAAQTEQLTPKYRTEILRWLLQRDYKGRPTWRCMPEFMDPNKAAEWSLPSFEFFDNDLLEMFKRQEFKRLGKVRA